MYAAQLIDAVKKACGYKTYRDLAAAIGVHETMVSAWRKNKGSPMPEDRVLQLCEMAKIADPAPWLAGVHSDGVSSAEAKKLWESLLDRIRPSVATTAMLGAVLLAISPLPSLASDHTADLNNSPLMHYAKLSRWLRTLLTRLTARFEHGYGPSALLA